MPPLPHQWLRTLATLGLLAWVASPVVIVLIVAVHRLYFVILPQRAIKKYKRTDPERLRRYLERVVATPSLIGPSQKLVARGAIAATYQSQGRHAEAVSHYRANLTTLIKLKAKANLPVFVALDEQDVHCRLADCLEALGETEEADKERRHAESCVAQAFENPLSHLTRGTLLKRENRYEEACEAFEQALALTPESNRPVRIECMVHLVLACFNAGRPAECLRWAEEAIALGAEGRYLRTAHRMAGEACGNLGRLEESEEYCRRAYDVAAEGDRGVMGQILGSLASIQHKRGKLEEANQACLQVAEMDPKAVRMAVAVRSQVLRDWGRFDEALEMLRRHGEAPGVVIPALERRLRAACALDMSRIEAECGRVDDAWVHIQEAVSELGNDAKLGLKCDGAAAWVFAVRGLADDSRRVAGQARARLPEFERDPGTCRGVLFDLGMAACARGDHGEGEDCWSRYLDLKPDPVYRPTAFYFRGECRRHLGDPSAARADFREAVAMEIDTHHARLARRRLTELALEPT